MNKHLLDINIIRALALKGNIFWTNHCLNRLNQRNISLKDIKNAISNGCIIEYYYDDFPYPSCLIRGQSINNKTIHIVCGVNEETIFMITSYYPDISEWDKDFKTRRKSDEMF